MKEKILTDNFLFFLHYLRAIRRAQREIRLDTYIFEMDRVGARVLYELYRASERGVQVHLTVDGFGSSRLLAHLRRQGSGGLYVRSYRLFPWPLGDRLTWNSLKHLPSLMQVFRHLNRRNHKKVLLVDHKLAILGSHNISERSLVWREMSVQVEDEAVVRDLAQVLAWSWEKCAGPFERLLPVAKRPSLRSGRLFFSAGPGRSRVFLRELKERLERAETRVQIATPYFAPPLSVVRRLNRAAARGVRVEVLISEKTDIMLFPRLSRVLYQGLLKAGVRIFEWPGPLLHAKSVAIDDWVVIGSSNMNPRSFLRDYELDYHLQERVARERVQTHFDQHREAAYEINVHNLPVSRLQAFLSYSLRRLLRYFL